jgi:hypothetical protein
MSRERQAGGRIWWQAGALATLVIIGVMVSLSLRHAMMVPAPVVTPASRLAGSKVGLTRLVQTGGDTLVSEEAIFFDPTPLFLPTEWNADQNSLPISALKDPGQMFQDFPSRLIFNEEGLSLSFPQGLRIPAYPVDALTGLVKRDPYQGMGRADVAVPELSERGGYMEVVASTDGHQVLSEALLSAKPPAGNWRPLEFIAVVNAAGLVGQLSLVEQSGVEQVDAYFQNYLAKTLKLGERLPPGFYRICVGP